MGRTLYLLGLFLILLPLLAVFPTGCGNTTSPYSPNPYFDHVLVTTLSDVCDYPAGIAVDSSGYIYVSDAYGRKIWKISPWGASTSVAGTGEGGAANGPATAATFLMPMGIAVDPLRNIYVADRGNDLIREILAGGSVSTVAGQTGVIGAANGPATAASFYWPNGVAVDSSGNLYVADTFNSLIREITPGGVVSTLAGGGPCCGTNGAGTAASFTWPNGIAVDPQGNVYVADTYNSLIRKITPGGMVSTLAGAGISGHTNGNVASASFNGPTGVAVDSSGNVYVADQGNNLIRKITPSGTVSTLAGSAGVTGDTNGPGTAATFNQPFGVAVDSSGNVYVTDTWNGSVRLIQQK